MDSCTQSSCDRDSLDETPRTRISLETAGLTIGPFYARLYLILAKMLILEERVVSLSFYNKSDCNDNDSSTPPSSTEVIPRSTVVLTHLRADVTCLNETSISNCGHLKHIVTATSGQPETRSET